MTMTANRMLSSALCTLQWVLLVSNVSAQGLQPAPETIKLVVGTSHKEHKRVLSDKGQALEVPLVFRLVGRESVAIEAELGEQGRFDIELASGKAAVELKDVRVEDGLGRAEIVRTVQPMSPQELRQLRDDRLEELAGEAAMGKARKAAEKAKPEEMRRFLISFGIGDPGGDDEGRLRALYARAKAFEGKSELLRKKLAEAADAHPRRFTAQDRKTWDAMKLGDLYLYYSKVLQTELAEEHLDRCGLDYDRSTRNAAEKVIPLFIALHSLMTGESPKEGEEAQAVKEAMSGGTGSLLWQALTVDLRLRIYSDAETADANSQWFNAQRVACRAIGVGRIRVEGTLDPDKGDAVDWWIIERWDPNSITFTSGSDGGAQFDPPQVVEGAARLRVAGKKAARYWFEMKTDRGDLNVVIHESHIPAVTKFPY
jgi:hypothetical protein